MANIRSLNDFGVRVVAVAQGLDMKPHSDTMSSLILAVLSGIAEFERTIIRERTLDGLAKARSKGVRFGRKPVHTQSEVALARQLREQGKS